MPRGKRRSNTTRRCGRTANYVDELIPAPKNKGASPFLNYEFEDAQEVRSATYSIPRVHTHMHKLLCIGRGHGGGGGEGNDDECAAAATHLTKESCCWML
jgi:hypothetical protein